MESNIENAVKTQIEEEEDCFYLQPSSSPYNITEKVQQANIDLFSSSPCPSSEKVLKVKFKDDLFSFEPDLTDEDFNSIESDQIDDIEQDNNVICEYKTVDIFDIEEVTEYVEEEEIIENIKTDFDELVSEVGIKNIEHRIKVDKEKHEIIKTDNITSSRNSKRKKINLKKTNCIQEVNCREHCIDKLMFDLPMYIKKLEIHEKAIDLPPLQLLQRKCCEEIEHKQFPHYNGLRSEYGLSSRQLEIKEKRKELLKLKKETREQILNEYTKRKIQQNEEVFCQWLKEIAKRKQVYKNKHDDHKSKKCRTVEKIKEPYNLINIKIPNKSSKRNKERPKTAIEYVPKTQIKKNPRPYTSSTCVYIEVPTNLLNNGINIGDLLVKNAKLSKKLHILTIS